MQKKLLAVAVLSAFSGLASAQSANVTLYGTLTGDFQSAQATGADSNTAATASNVNSSVRTAASINANPNSNGARTRMNPAGSNIGFRGTEDLGNGLSAWFQAEIALTLGAPSGVPDGTNHGNAVTWRNSAVGLRSTTWGTASVGSWDTPFNVMINSLSINGRTTNATTGTTSNLMGSHTAGSVGAWSAQNETAACIVGVGVTAGTCVNAVTNFDRRQKAIVQWWSPNWNGLEVRAAYSATAFADAATGTALSNTSSLSAPNLRPAIWDLSLSYTNGPLMVGYAYERQKDLWAYGAYTAANSAGPGTTAISAFAATNTAYGLTNGNGTGAYGTQLSSATLGTITNAGSAVIASGSTATGHRLGARYTFSGIGSGALGIGGVWESLKYDMSYTAMGTGAAQVGSLINGLQKKAWRIETNYAWGNHIATFAYTRANALTGSIANFGGATNTFNGSDTGARAFVLGYAYTLSKRTSIMGYYMDVKNDTNAAYSGSTFAGVGTSAGADPKYVGMSMRHAF